jgi:hypothetical protein
MSIVSDSWQHYAGDSCIKFGIIMLAIWLFKPATLCSQIFAKCIEMWNAYYDNLRHGLIRGKVLRL